MTADRARLATLRSTAPELLAARLQYPDPLQLPEPEPCATVAYPDGIDLLEGASRATWLWLVATAAVTAGLAAVLLVLGLRRITRG